MRLVMYRIRGNYLIGVENGEVCYAGLRIVFFLDLGFLGGGGVKTCSQSMQAVLTRM